MFGSVATRPVDRVSYSLRPVRSADATEERYAQVVPPPARTDGQTPAYQPTARHESRGTIELNLLGGFRLVMGGQLVQVSRTGQRLLAVLACNGRQTTRRQMAHALWPDTTSSRAHANLRTALYRLYRSCPGVIHATSSYVQLAVGIQIDLEQTTRMATHILSHDITSDHALLNEALRINLYNDLLPEWDDEWLGDHQYRYRQLRLTALETLSEQLAAAGHHGAAVQTALAAVQADSLRDSAHQTLIRACLAQGNRNEALTHYSTYRRILRDELGLDPPPAIGQLLTGA
jgi:DNA-binding SARP family transcriptional activator